MVQVGLIGYGYWGKNLLRNFVENDHIELVGVFDIQPDRLLEAQKTYPQVKTFSTLEALLSQKSLEAIAIATPPASHFELADICLQRDLHLMIEKPMALSSEHCQKIIDLARQRERVLMVDHTYVFQPAISHLKSIIENDKLGNLLYFDSVRVNLGGFQPEVNVLWDLAPHDLSILDFILNGACPHKVFATGMKYFGTNVESLCYAVLHYENNFMAHLHLNWAAPVKVRKIMIGGDKKMVVYDDNQPLEKVKVYDQSVDLQNPSRKDFTVNYRIGEMHSPVILQKEPLAEAVESFAQQISHQTTMRSDGESGRRVVRVLEALSQSLDSGQTVAL